MLEERLSWGEWLVFLQDREYQGVCVYSPLVSLCICTIWEFMWRQKVYPCPVMWELKLIRYLHKLSLWLRIQNKRIKTNREKKVAGISLQQKRKTKRKKNRTRSLLCFVWGCHRKPPLKICCMLSVRLWNKLTILLLVFAEPNWLTIVLLVFTEPYCRMKDIQKCTFLHTKKEEEKKEAPLTLILDLLCG